MRCLCCCHQRPIATTQLCLQANCYDACVVATKDPLLPHNYVCNSSELLRCLCWSYQSPIAPTQLCSQANCCNACVAPTKADCVNLIIQVWLFCIWDPRLNVPSEGRNSRWFIYPTINWPWGRAVVSIWPTDVANQLACQHNCVGGTRASKDFIGGPCILGVSLGKPLIVQISLSLSLDTSGSGMVVISVLIA